MSKCANKIIALQSEWARTVHFKSSREINNDVNTCADTRICIDKYSNIITVFFCNKYHPPQTKPLNRLKIDNNI